MAQILRPIATVTVAEWQDQLLGTALHEATDEDPPDDDATFITTLTPPAGTECKIRLAGGEDPGVDTAHFIEVRHRKSASAGKTTTLTINWYDSDATTLLASTITVPLTETYVVATLTLTEAQASGIADYSAGLVVGFSVVQSGIGADRTVRITRIQQVMPSVASATVKATVRVPRTEKAALEAARTEKGTALVTRTEAAAVEAARTEKHTLSIPRTEKAAVGLAGKPRRG